MATTLRDIREYLLSSDNEFQRLAQEHSRCEEELERLKHQPYLNSDDLILETVLKKRKLHLKDEMERLIVGRQKGIARS